jgi:hypothetical protein
MNNFLSNYIEILFHIINSYYNYDNNVIDVIELYIINFLKPIIFKFSSNLLGICLHQEFDKLIFKKINNDVINYKFKEEDRIYISQFANPMYILHVKGMIYSLSSLQCSHLQTQELCYILKMHTLVHLSIHLSMDRLM